MMLAFKALLVWLPLVSICSAEKMDKELRMPGVQPQVNDTYLCYAMKIDQLLYITGFGPHADMNTAHHMLLYGCKEPGDEQKPWNCGEMAATGKKSDFGRGPVCKSGSQIIYAWAMDAPPLQLPKDVAFKVGGDTSVKYMVVQVHYKDVRNFIPPKNQKDTSGITLHTTTTPKLRRAAVYLLGTGGMIPGKSTVYMEAACDYDEPIVLHPFAYRTHAHTHGAVVSGYRVRDGEWTEIGRHSPQLPQMFYNTTNPGMDVKKGDILAARCTMVNKDKKSVYIGSTQNDEMCNFYMMFYVDGTNLPQQHTCFTAGPPQWNWNSFAGLDRAAAPKTASVVPGTTEVLKETPNAILAQQEAQGRGVRDYLDSYNIPEDNEESLIDDENLDQYLTDKERLLELEEYLRSEDDDYY
ncbi:probable peptidylglycine alpha-hydroxylating monooxygenase 1 isoform X2 [Lineus longissimus]|uniref:probable peptidylglycine alpha-hydroxylating monooxygenase 1 isoform X2 n=1 Tax=Lineus longissimus TaxID=88925 RepID=UPI00315C9507